MERLSTTYSVGHQLLPKRRCSNTCTCFLSAFPLIPFTIAKPTDQSWTLGLQLCPPLFVIPSLNKSHCSFTSHPLCRVICTLFNLPPSCHLVALLYLVSRQLAGTIKAVWIFLSARLYVSLVFPSGIVNAFFYRPTLSW